MHANAILIFHIKFHSECFFISSHIKNTDLNQIDN